MPEYSFELWLPKSGAQHVQFLSTLHPADIKGTPVIGVEARHFLDQYLYPSKEPLIPALGGWPLALEGVVIEAIKNIEKAGVKLWFYFDGLDCAFDNTSFSVSTTAAEIVSVGFDIYEDNHPTYAIEKFRTAEHPIPARLYAYLKCILHKHNIGFVTAPFRALAQMQHDLEKDIIHVLYASSEAFLYGATKLISRINVVYEHRDVTDENGVPQKGSKGNIKKYTEFVLDKSTYTWVELSTVLKSLGNISQESFQDALLFAGNSYIEAFPPLTSSDQPSTFHQAITHLASSQYDIYRAAEFHPSENSGPSWFDRFKNAHEAIRNMPVVKSMVQFVPRSKLGNNNLGPVPRDNHEIIGLVLPEELVFYMYSGMIGPRVLNWLVSGKIKLHAPLAGEKTSQYRRLVKDQLKPLREDALALVAYSINRYFQTRAITTTSWFEDNEDKVLLKQVTSQKDSLSKWSVKEAALSKVAAGLPQGPGSLAFAFLSLKDPAFASSTIKGKRSADDRLDTSEEIVSNSIWRLLHLCKYVDGDHKLTAWGKVMATVLEKLGARATKEQAEAAFVAVELLRLGHLNTDELVSGNGPRGSGAEAKNTLLFSRVAAIGKMHHSTKGFIGPLSRSLLAFHSLVSEVRLALRDIVEMATASMFLENQALRNREDMEFIAELLPFQENWSDGLGILAMTYLDEVVKEEKPEEEKAQTVAMEKSESYLAHTEVRRSYKDALDLWAAVTEGVKTSESLVGEKDKKFWTSASDWVLARSKAFA